MDPIPEHIPHKENQFAWSMLEFDESSEGEGEEGEVLLLSFLKQGSRDCT